MVYKWLTSIQSSLTGPCLLCGGRCTLPDGLALCDGCRNLLPATGRHCPNCAQPQTSDARCGPCQRHPPPFERAIAPWLYAPPLDRLVLQLKTSAAGPCAHALGGLLARHLAASGCELPDLIVPVPLHARRLRERGFNQAAMLARVLARKLGVPWRADVLLKPHESADQRQLDKRQRRRNLRGCFTCRPLPTGCHVALVDDVVTTGATAWAGSEALRRAGAARVAVWALARTP